MIPYLVLLRGVNVGGHQQISMAELCAAISERGCAHVKSLLRSGNVVFRSQEPESVLETGLADAIARRFTLNVECFVRNLPEWESTVSANPFPQAARDDPGHLLVMALRRAPTQDEMDALRAAITGRETVHAGGRHLYIIYPEGIARSKLTNALIERRLGIAGTARNWNTALKMLEMLRA